MKVTAYDVQRYLEAKYPRQRPSRLYLTDDADLRALVRTMKPDEQDIAPRSVVNDKAASTISVVGFINILAKTKR